MSKKIIAIIGMVALLTAALPVHAISKFIGTNVTDTNINFQVVVKPADRNSCVGSLISADMVLTTAECALQLTRRDKNEELTYDSDMLVYHKGRVYIVKDVFTYRIYTPTAAVTAVILHLENKVMLDTAEDTINILRFPAEDLYETVIRDKSVRYTLFAFLGTSTKNKSFSLQFGFTDVFMPIKQKDGTLAKRVKLSVGDCCGTINKDDIQGMIFGLESSKNLYEYPSSIDDIGGVLTYKVNGEYKPIGLVLYPGYYVNLSYPPLRDWYTKVLTNPSLMREYAILKTNSNSYHNLYDQSKCNIPENFKRGNTEFMPSDINQRRY